MANVLEGLELQGRRRVPFHQQSEGSECGLACLSMVADSHGLLTDTSILRQKFAISLKGATLKQLISIAEAIGFSTRPVRIEMEELRHLSLPAILHWDLRHFVVLAGTSNRWRGRRYVIHDPAVGVLNLSENEVGRRFTGVALELLKSENFRPKAEFRKLRIGQLWSSMRGFWQTIRLVMFLSVVLQLIALASPFYMQIAIDTALPAMDNDLLKVVALGFLLLGIIQFGTTLLRSLIVTTFNASLTYQMVVNLFRHLVRLPLSWFEKRHVGDVISRFGSTKPVTQLLSEGLVTASIDGLMATATFVLMFVYSEALSAIALGALAAFALLRFSYLQAIRLRNISVISATAIENSSFIESVRGIAAVKAFAQESNRQRLWQRNKANAVNAEIKLNRMSNVFDSLTMLIMTLERVAFVYVAVRLAMKGTLTIGMVFAFQAYKQQFLDCTTRLINQSVSWAVVQVHLGRLADIVLSPAEDEMGPHTAETPNAAGAIELRDVRYRYGVGEQEVLRGVNITVEPGEFLAIAGPSGGGKTTLMKIMMGLFDPTYGSILVDGKPLVSFSRQSFRSQIGCVSQEDALYAGTLAENISFFDPEIDMERVVKAAQLACIRSDIETMPLRYETLVGDMGSTLSGGQKQRVLLARALYAEPKILFMDEGTAHLDVALETEVVASLASLGITRVVIAHRPQSIAAADRIIAIAAGHAIPVPKAANSTVETECA